MLPLLLIMHTPDALDNVLKTINDIRTKRATNSLWVVVEIEIKQNVMAGIATDLSDKAILPLIIQEMKIQTK
jgi:UDP-N-acetylmuramoyl-L-alanyl-D-glutamate--2,6-diaminopimelate ligase